MCRPSRTSTHLPPSGRSFSGRGNPIRLPVTTRLHGRGQLLSLGTRLPPGDLELVAVVVLAPDDPLNGRATDAVAAIAGAVGCWTVRSGAHRHTDMILAHWRCGILLPRGTAIRYCRQPRSTQRYRRRTSPASERANERASGLVDPRQTGSLPRARRCMVTVLVGAVAGRGSGCCSAGRPRSGVGGRVRWVRAGRALWRGGRPRR
jgi:hypothetical protein